VIKVEDKDACRTINLITDQGNYTLDIEMHTVGLHTQERHLFTFDSFMNHSCDPTTFSSDAQYFPDGGTYKTVARRDIAANEEITCDYDLFECDSLDKKIDVCECASPLCRSYEHGFYFMAINHQIALLPYACEEVSDAWNTYHNDSYLHIVQPIPNIGIISGSSDGGIIIVTSPIASGDTIFQDVNIASSIPDTYRDIVLLFDIYSTQAVGTYHVTDENGQSLEMWYEPEKSTILFSDWRSKDSSTFAPVTRLLSNKSFNSNSAEARNCEVVYDNSTGVYSFVALANLSIGDKLVV
jgi:hypothetical protein